MTPIQHQENMRKTTSERMKKLAKQDNKSVGNYTNIKSSIRDDSHTHELNRYMDLG